jgi:hypothetical protein
VSERRRFSQLFTFPDPVNETSARLVAAGVVMQGVAFLVVRQWWVLVPLAIGFVARVASGPRFSPLGRFVTEVLTPRLHRAHRMVPGPPKRFAQAIGLSFSASALVAELLGADVVAIVLIACLVLAAALESFVGLCLGCMAFQRLMQWGLIPQSVCASCNDIGARLNARSPDPVSG